MESGHTHASAGSPPNDKESTVELKSDASKRAALSAPTGSSHVAVDRASALDLAELILEGLDKGGSSNAPSARDPETWKGRMLGDYRIDAELGRGATGIVFKATNMRVGSTVALKILRMSPGEAADRLERFELEARAAALLNHPNIVNVFDTGRSGDLYFLAMEYIEGRPLSELTDKGPLDPRQAVRIAMDVCNAIEFAHVAGVIHRDIKPSNILIEPSGQAQVMDFGLARDITRVKGRHTESGSIVGTVHYMSPEQASGNSHQADSRSDIYGIGAVLYEMCTGQPPFDAPSKIEVIRKVATDEPIAPRRLNGALDRDLETIILKAMAKDAKLRYRSAAALSEDLWRYQSGQPILAKPTSLLRRFVKFIQRHRAPALAASIMLVSLGTIILGIVLHDNEVVRRLEDRMRLAENHHNGAPTDNTPDTDLEARVQERVEAARAGLVLDSELAALNDPARGRWLALHAARLAGQPQDALDLLSKFPPTTDVDEKFNRGLWEALLRHQADREHFSRLSLVLALGPVRFALRERQRQDLIAVVDVYIEEGLEPDPTGQTPRQAGLLEFHKGNRCLMDGDLPKAREYFMRAAQNAELGVERVLALYELKKLPAEAAPKH